MKDFFILALCLCAVGGILIREIFVLCPDTGFNVIEVDSYLRYILIYKCSIHQTVTRGIYKNKKAI